jgi:phage-related protein
MSKTFKLNRAGVRQLMQSTEMQAVLQEKASQIAARCGDGYEQDIMVGRNRANAQVWAETSQAKRDNSKNNTILKAVRG